MSEPDASVEIRWYRVFYDVPRIVCVPFGNGEVLLSSAFEDQSDDYAAAYSVHWFPKAVENPDAMISAAAMTRPVATVPIDDVQFDPTRRRRLTLPKGLVDRLAELVG